MSDILVINLGTSRDIFCTGQLVSSLKSQYPHSRISLLVYKQYKDSARVLSNVSEIFSIDRKKITSYKKNKLFSNGFALQEFFSSIHPLSNKTWDLLINLSENSVSNRIASYLSKAQFLGSQFSDRNNIEYSSDWALALNEVINNYPTPIQIVEPLHKATNIPFENGGIKFRTQAEHNENAHRHLNDLRKSVGFNNKNLKIIALHLQSEDSDSSIPYEAILDTIGLILDDPDLYPILLIGASDNERILSERVNSHFDNSLLTVESDYLALPSVLVNVDLVLTANSDIKQLADLVDLPCVDVYLNTTDSFSYNTIRSNNLTLRRSSNDEFNEDDYNDLSLNLYRCIKLSFDFDESHLRISGRFRLHQTKRLKDSIYFYPVAGDINWVDEVNLSASKDLFEDLIEQRTNTKELSSFVLRNISKENFTKWHQDEKNTLTDLSKILLNTIREFKQIKLNSKSHYGFLKSFERLTTFENSVHLCAIPSLLFKGRIDSLPPASFEENYEHIERFLFGLKNDIQTLNNLIDEYYSDHKQQTLPRRRETIVQL